MKLYYMFHRLFYNFPLVLLSIDFLFGDNLFIAKNKALKYSSNTIFWTSVHS